jgi:hypothetical protein
MPAWVILLGALSVGGAVLRATLSRSRRSTQALIALGLALGFGFVLFAYFDAPPSNPLYNAYDACGASVCGSYLGRWWAPDFAVLYAAIGYACWLAGVWVGAQARRTTSGHAPPA